jgi:hypothetical protein
MSEMDCIFKIRNGYQPSSDVKHLQIYAFLRISLMRIPYLGRNVTSGWRAIG